MASSQNSHMFNRHQESDQEFIRKHLEEQPGKNYSIADQLRRATEVAEKKDQMRPR